jgi:hypothetical protein
MIYTVATHKKGFPVSYIDKDTHEVQAFAPQTVFADPGEACHEFEAWAGGRARAEYVTPYVFALRIAKIAALREKMKNWNALSAGGKPA